MAKRHASKAKGVTAAKAQDVKVAPAVKRQEAKAAPVEELKDVASASFQGFGIEWKARRDGSAELVLAYHGPLADRDAVIARAGTRREGAAPWNETREVTLRRNGAGWVGSIPVGPGAPVEAVEFVFRNGDEWDNGGRAPLGYYEWSPRERRLDVH